MAAEDIAEPRMIVARVPQSTAVVVRPVHRGVVANVQRSVRRMWLQFFVDHWGHRAAA
jgi:actin-like ATPase involved in cell morphogenesis